MDFSMLNCPGLALQKVTGCRAVGAAKTFDVIVAHSIACMSSGFRKKVVGEKSSLLCHNFTSSQISPYLLHAFW